LELTFVDTSAFLLEIIQRFMCLLMQEKVCKALILTLVLHNYPESVVLESSAKPSLGKKCLPRLGLTDDSRTTEFPLGLLVLIFIGKTSLRLLWTYLRDWFTLTLHELSHVMQYKG